MKCEATNCSHGASFSVSGPGMAKRLCGCCAAKATDVAGAAGIRVTVTDLSGTEVCAIAHDKIDVSTMTTDELLMLHEAAHDELHRRLKTMPKELS